MSVLGEFKRPPFFDQTIKDLWPDYSASVIAAVLTLTMNEEIGKNIVCGRSRRLGLANTPKQRGGTPYFDEIRYALKDLGYELKAHRAP